MKICIPIEFKPHGGGHYFLQMFEAYLKEIGWQVAHQIYEKADVLFTNHWMISRREILKSVRVNPDMRIIQRIDGAAEDYGRDREADDQQAAVNQLADLTIFQSEYCRYSTRQKFHVIRQDGPVIHNPVDSDLFFPEARSSNSERAHQVACVSWSTNPLKGAEKIYAVAQANRDINFVLCGNYPDAPDQPNLKKRGYWIGWNWRQHYAPVDYC